jgi:lysophospholipase L1-like esterase
MAAPDSRPAGAANARYRRALIWITVGAIALLLLGAEAAVRVRAHIKYGITTQIEDYYTVDKKLGLRVARAGYSKGRISVNGAGFRGPEIAMPKPPGTLRIAFLGASAVWCAEVSGNDHVWADIVTNTLRKTFPQASFDYVNAGLPGYTMPTILKNYQLRVAPLQPDVVVIYESANNISGELRDLAVARGIIAQPKMKELSWPAHYSMLWYLVEKNLDIQFSQRAAQGNQGRLEVDPRTLGEGYRKELRDVVRAAQQTAKLVAVAPYSTQLRRDQTPAQQMRAAESEFYFLPFVTTGLIMDAYDRYNDVAREVARETGALLIDGVNDVPGDPQHFADTVHFTDAGSAVMAERISRGLVASPRFGELVSTDAAAK